MIGGLTLGTGALIVGYSITSNTLWRQGLYMVAIGSLLGLLMSRQPRANRVDIILEENGLRRVKGKDLQKTIGKAKIRDISKWGDILGFELKSGAIKGHDYIWVDKYGGPSVLTASHQKPWLLYKDLAQKGPSYNLSRADLYQIVHWQKRIKKKYTE